MIFIYFLNNADANSQAGELQNDNEPNKIASRYAGPLCFWKFSG